MAKQPKPFSLADYGVLKEGILAESAGFKPLKNFGVDFTLRPETTLSTLPAVGGLINIGQAIGKYQTEDAATKLLNQQSPNQLSSDFQDTLKRAGTGKSATNAIINEIKKFKADDPYSTSSNITRDDIQNYLMSKNLGLDLAPIQVPKYTKSELDEQNDRIGGFKQKYQTQPFGSGGTFRAFDDLPQTTIPNTSDYFRYNAPFMTEDEKGNIYATGKTLAEEIKSGTFDDQLKSTDQFAEDKINQVNFGTRDAQGNFKGAKGYDPAFARAVTLQNQKEAGSDTPSESTFICTVLYDLNDMPIKIYKYDQRYGQQVNKKIYRGYATWGKPLAERMRNKGLLYKIMKPIALRWAEQMAFDMSEGKVGKKRYAIKVMKFLGEAICYTIGLFIKPEGDKNGTRNRNRQHGEERGAISRKDGILKKRGRPRIKRRAIS